MVTKFLQQQNIKMNINRITRKLKYEEYVFVIINLNDIYKLEDIVTVPKFLKPKYNNLNFSTWSLALFLQRFSFTVKDSSALINRMKWQYCEKIYEHI